MARKESFTDHCKGFGRGGFAAFQVAALDGREGAAVVVIGFHDGFDLLAFGMGSTKDGCLASMVMDSTLGGVSALDVAVAVLHGGDFGGC